MSFWDNADLVGYVFSFLNSIRDICRVRRLFRRAGSFLGQVQSLYWNTNRILTAGTIVGILNCKRLTTLHISAEDAELVDASHDDFARLADLPLTNVTLPKIPGLISAFLMRYRWNPGLIGKVMDLRLIIGNGIIKYKNAKLKLLSRHPDINSEAKEIAAMSGDFLYCFHSLPVTKVKFDCRVSWTVLEALAKRTDVPISLYVPKGVDSNFFFDDAYDNDDYQMTQELQVKSLYGKGSGHIEIPERWLTTLKRCRFPWSNVVALNDFIYRVPQVKIFHLERNASPIGYVAILLQRFPHIEFVVIHAEDTIQLDQTIQECSEVIEELQMRLAIYYGPSDDCPGKNILSSPKPKVGASGFGTYRYPFRKADPVRKRAFEALFT